MAGKSSNWPQAGAGEREREGGGMLKVGGKMRCNRQQSFCKMLTDPPHRGDSSFPPPCRPPAQVTQGQTSDVSIFRETREAGNCRMKTRGGKRLSSKISNTFSSLPSRVRAPFQQAGVCAA